MRPLDPTAQYLVAGVGQFIVHDGLYLTEREIDCHPYYDLVVYPNWIVLSVTALHDAAAGLHPGRLMLLSRLSRPAYDV